MGARIALAVAGACAAAALYSAALLLAPSWPVAAVAPEAPTLPISVAGVVFNAPPQAIRFPLQRRPGEQPRLDLAFQWPHLTAPERPPRKPAAADLIPSDQLFLSIAAPGGALPIAQRVRTIYPRYISAQPFAGPHGLSGVAFRDHSPYHNEDLFYAEADPELFLARCTRAIGSLPGVCLLEKSVGAAEMTARFPRAWLVEWPEIAAAIDRLVAGLRRAE